MYKKVCRGCNIEKNETEFHKRTVSPDGLDTKCRVCRSVYTSRIPTGLEHAPEKDRVYAESILRGLGYELYNKKNPVYKQFNQRLIEKSVNLDDYPDTLY